jgi:molybdenum cofactor biosynthesis enzyme MoaA
MMWVTKYDLENGLLRKLVHEINEIQNPFCSHCTAERADTTGLRKRHCLQKREESSS